MGLTSIQWTATPRQDGTFAPGYTFNTHIGCAKCSEGCQFCYAEAEQDHRYHRATWGPGGTRSMTSVAYWKQPARWDREAAAAGERHKVFCASLADIFEEWPGRIHDSKGNVLWYRPERGIIRAGQATPGLACGERTATMDDIREQLRWLMFSTENLDWLLLTKRIGFAARWIADHLMPPNYWIGTSVENRRRFDERVPVIRTIPAAVRFLSVEPLLEDLGEIDLDGIDWVVIGGESVGGRPCNVAWIERIVDQCRGAGVPAFVKQLGSCPVATAVPGYTTGLPKLKHPKGGDPSEWPERFRVRQFPEPAAVSA